MAVAFPHGLGRILFYRHDAGSAAADDDVLVPSFADPANSALIAGDRPYQLAAADMDQNGAVDLVVASADAQLRTFLNSGQTNPTRPNEVNLAALLPSATAPALPPGIPALLLLGDANGDGVFDLVAVTDAGLPPHHDYAVACYLNRGTGELNNLRILPPVRTGNQVVAGGVPTLRDAMAFPVLGDVNRDGMPDLVVAWGTAATGDRNVRVLFGAAR